MEILTTLIPALLPAVTDGIRAGINRVTGGAGAKPANVAEVVQLMDAETKRLQMLAQLDAAPGVSQWVANIRALQRPVATALVLSAYGAAVLGNADNDVILRLAEFAQIVTFYLFGDRTYMYLKRKA